MELQLSLALPTYDPKGTTDLNKHEFEPNGMVRLKRGFEEAFGKNGGECRSKNLLLWSGQPNEEDGGNSRKITSSHTNNGGGKEDGVVGWPPIKSSMKNLFHRGQVAGPGDHANGRSMYVKVKMEGVAIARKVDMRLFHSYQALTNSLISMFANYYDDKDGAGMNTVIYQDTDGDWLLVGDVPWQTFMGSVQRLEILRNYN